MTILTYADKGTFGKINAYVSLSSAVRDSERDYDKIISKLEKDDFELLIRAKYNGAWVNLMGQGQRGRFVLCAWQSGILMILRYSKWMDNST